MLTTQSMPLLNLNIYQEPLSLIKFSLQRLLDVGYYNIQTRFDGTFREDVMEYLLNKNVDVTIGQNYKQQMSGGKVTELYLQRFIEKTNHDYLIKIDPDTICHQKLFRFPDENNLGCNWSEKRITVFGGCLVFSRNIANKLLQSNLLTNDKYKTKQYMYHHKKLNIKLASQDKIIYDICNTLGIGYERLDDQVCCQSEYFDASKHYCFTHFND